MRFQMRKAGIGCGMALLLFFACGSGEQDSHVIKTVTHELPNQEGWNSKIFISQEGKTRAVVYFGHMVHYERRKVYYFDQGVSIDFFDEEENHTSRLTSEQGEYHEQSEDVFNVFVEVANATGGIVDNAQNPAAGFRTAAQAASDYYLLFYSPVNYRKDGTFKKITVRIKDRDYQVIHRAGYYAN